MPLLEVCGAITTVPVEPVLMLALDGNESANMVIVLPF
jgi:hypothetical protein